MNGKRDLLLEGSEFTRANLASEFALDSVVALWVSYGQSERARTLVDDGDMGLIKEEFCWGCNLDSLIEDDDVTARLAGATNLSCSNHRIPDAFGDMHAAEKGACWMGGAGRVYIVGCKGAPARYGGFETFAGKLTESRASNAVACAKSSDGSPALSRWCVDALNSFIMSFDILKLRSMALNADIVLVDPWKRNSSSCLRLLESLSPAAGRRSA